MTDFQKNLMERFVRYAKTYSESSEKNADAGVIPSTPQEWDLAKMLEAEMKALGLENVHITENCYVYGCLKASAGLENVAPFALLAHLDTVEEVSGKDVKPQIIENYDGRPLELGSSGRVLDPEIFPDLKASVGKTLIVTDGTTVLGADDKAGIAEILCACERIINRQLPHGRISVCFTPDEEIGHGAELLDLERFGADFAFTVDGDAVNILNYETFNAAEAVVEISGVNVHPGDAKGKMKNAALIASEFNSLLPADEIPAMTEGYEGFYHLLSLNANVERAQMKYIIRDHDAGIFEERKKKMLEIEKALNRRFGEGCIKVTIRDQYRNMADILNKRPEIIELAHSAILKAGLEPVCVPVRGGTDGAELSFRGLPCPNLGTGGNAFHGPYEHITAEDMDKAVEVLVNLLSK